MNKELNYESPMVALLKVDVEQPLLTMSFDPTDRTEKLYEDFMEDL